MKYLRGCTQIVYRRWTQNRDLTDQQHINETGVWPKDFNEVTMIAFNMEPKATNMQRPTQYQYDRTYRNDS
jgi:hypothetical protein